MQMQFCLSAPFPSIRLLLTSWKPLGRLEHRLPGPIRTGANVRGLNATRSLHLKWAGHSEQVASPALHAPGSVLLMDVNDVYLWLCSAQPAPAGIGAGSDGMVGNMTVVDHVFWPQRCYVLSSERLAFQHLDCVLQTASTPWFHKDRIQFYLL